MKLKAEKREITGKKVKKLRSEGKVPASVYGPSLESQNITLDAKEFGKVFDSRGYSKFIQLELEGHKDPVRVLVKSVNIHPLKDHYVEVSLYAVDEGKKITVDVPVVLEGEAPAVKQNIGFLVQQMDSISLYCLPKNLPEELIVDISGLVEIGDSITVNEIEIGEDVELSSGVEPTNAIAFIAAPQKEIVEEEPETSEEGEEDEESGQEDGDGEDGDESSEGGEDKKSEE